MLIGHVDRCGVVPSARGSSASPLRVNSKESSPSADEAFFKCSIPGMMT